MHWQWGRDVGCSYIHTQTSLNRIGLFVGKLDCARLLLRHGADPNSRTRSGMTPAHLAAEKGDVKCLQLLMGYKASMDSEDNVGALPADIAKTYGNHCCVRFLEMSHFSEKMHQMTS